MIYGDFSSGNLGFGTGTPGNHRIYATSIATGAAGSTGYFANTAAAGIAMSIENFSNTSSDASLLVTTKGSAGDIVVFDSYHGTGSWDREFRFTNTGDGRCDGSWIGGGADYAEYFPKSDSTLNYEPGDVILISDKGYAVETSSDDYSLKIVGVYSTNPVVIGNSSADKDPENSVLVGMMGVVPTKVNVINGEIKVGDFITSSTIPGVAMKASKSGIMIGRALESYSGKGTAKIKVLVNVGWVAIQDDKINLETTIEMIKKLEVEINSLKSQIGNASNK